MDQADALRQRLLQNEVTQGASPAPLRSCLLSGGASRRMGQDKALLPHPEGGCWLERTLRLLAALRAPITLLSRWPEHLALAGQLAEQPTAAAPATITVLAEPSPWEGPLLALHRLMEHHPNQRLLLCPVDMPNLTLSVLESLLAAAEAAPGAIHLAHDGERLQPLLGLYPSGPAQRNGLAAAIGQGERRLQSWLTHQPCHRVTLDARTIRNLNRPDDI
ncbi:molybdenum cofactor guanylyltransferase [Synechococcus sp. HJ21-Hayes]|uniref:molybdenum cofactor guanylyltransferase n=1 Tax=unclassified Synechococcus TaxID=2626047 RepID=UPI0020CE9ABC|nr:MULTISPECIES: molybdenum cofactor guanylyltransferase [unclassified Synechococcus]MCP9831312.1 molybdenum cofactor guanylyltransferase [Synechococcus sp. JJ3a-Johnson]MCP9853604.1 molybdenum cofactor guanylyltransferase [Synechococcus sp. HJ21-Hayes]